jgi:hypothetical protein
MLHSSTVPIDLFERMHDQTTVASFKGLEYYPSVQQAMYGEQQKLRTAGQVTS